MSAHDTPFDVAIIGGGCSGVLTAVQLVRQSNGTPPRIAVIESRPALGQGTAYSTRGAEHLLNVPAANMSALPDDPQHFLNWARQNGAPAAPDAYLPRGLYGEYLAALFDDAARVAAIARVHGHVEDIRHDGRESELILTGGRRLRAARVGLAAGNFPPAVPAVDGLADLALPSYANDPWSADALDALGPDDSLLLIGTGLTMLDVALQLRARGHGGTIHAVSRRGLLPQPHVVASPASPLPAPPEVLNAQPSVIGLLRGLRAAVRREAEAGRDWRDVIGSIRSITAALWQALPPRERARFLRHARPYWDTHRHRAAPEVATAIQRMLHAGQLVVHAGRMVRVARHDGGVQAVIRHRQTSELATLQVARIINCTGPESDVRRLKDPLWMNLLQRGLIQRDEFGLGILTDADGAVLDATGRASDWLFLIGPMRKAQLWEGTAVPELRVHARDLARRLRGTSAPTA